VVPYLHDQPVMPLDATADRPWLLPLMALIGPSLTRLPDAVDLSRFFVTATVEFAEAAAKATQAGGRARGDSSRDWTGVNGGLSPHGFCR
jgi:glutamyl-tRNA synthetase